MKKIIALSIFAVLSLCLIMDGCQQSDDKKTINDNTFVDGQDYQYQFSNTFLYDDKINKSENGYYFTVDDFLYYMDAETMKATPLCNKPNCLHDKENSEELKRNCNAYISAVDSNIYYNNGYIYYMNELVDLSSGKNSKKIIRCSSDGSTKEVLTSFENSKYVFMLVHRGYVYYSATYFTVTDNKNDKGENIVDGNTKIYRLNINESNSKPEVFLENSDFDVNNIPIVRGISAYGNYIVLNVETSNVSQQNNSDSTVVDNVYFYTANLETKKVTNISKTKFPNENEKIMDFTYFDGKLLVSPIIKDGDESYFAPEVYSMDFDGTNLKKVYTKTGKFSKCELYADENYIYIPSLNFYESDGNDESEPSVKNITLGIIDHDFKMINQAEVPLANPHVNYTNTLSSNGDKFISYTSTCELDENGKIVDEDKIVYYIKYIDKADLIKKGANLQWKTAYQSDPLSF